MLDKLKSLTKASLIYGVGHILSRLVTFLLLPYYSFRITPAEYGEISLYFLFLAIVQTFYLYGLDIAYLRYFSLANEPEQRSRITATTIWTSLLSSSVLTLLIFLSAEPLGYWLIDRPVHPEQVGAMIQICAAILFFDTLTTFPFLLLRSTHRPLQFAAIKLLNVAVNIGLNIAFISGLGMTVDGVLWANLIASAFTLLVLIPSIVREGMTGFSGAALREMLAFGLPNIPTYLFVMVVELASRKIVELMRGIEEAGLFSAGYKLGMFMAVVTGAFRFAWQPFFLSRSDDENAPRLFARVMTYYIAVALFLFVGLTFFVPSLIKQDWPVIGLLLDERYWPGLVVFPLILFAHIFDGIYANLMVGVYLKKLTRFLPLATGAAAAFTVMANILLVPQYGMIAAGWITVFAFIIQAAIVYVIVRRYYPIPYEWSRIVKLFAISLGLVLLSYIFPFSQIGYKVILFLAFPAFLYLIRFFDEREIYHVKRIFSRA